MEERARKLAEEWEARPLSLMRDLKASGLECVEAKWINWKHGINTGWRPGDR
jgi:hypothetical protein